MNDVDLKAQFHREMLRLYREAAAFDYYPTRFLQMVNADLQTLILGTGANR